MTALEHDRLAGASRPKLAEKTRKVWDWPVRLFHWSLVLAVIGAYVTNRLGVAYFSYHLFFGYAVIVLVVFRVFWGFVGTKHARFVNFLRGPKAILRYISASGTRTKIALCGA